MRALLISLLFLASACTTLGMDDVAARDGIYYGSPVAVRLCVLQDEGVSNVEATALITAIRKEMAPFGIFVDVPWVKPWKRQGFDYMEILQGVVRAHALSAPCDRIAAFVGRNAGDILWGAMLMPEVLGAVETVTRTRGFMVASFGSVNQVFASPRQTAAHEFYHMLGCKHDVTMNLCYRQIVRMKEAARAARAGGADMVPGILSNGEYIAERQAIDRLLSRVVWD